MIAIPPAPRPMFLPLAALLLVFSAMLVLAAGVSPPKDYRGMAVTVGADQSAFIGPGDRVDILVTFDALMANKKKEKVTATILQNVQVLAVLRSKLGAEHSILYLAVNPNEAQYLALAIDGDYTIRVIDRKEGDVTMKPMEMASFRKLFK